MPGAEIFAVGSRSEERAESFADEFSAAKSYGSYEELASDSELDAVYVATPHSHHAEHSIMCMEKGRAVLCEKPLAVNARQVERMIACARENGVFLMEAMWTRFLPVMERVREWLAEGAIGEVQMLQADFGFRGELDPGHRLFNPELAGGALLDVGVYTLALSYMVFGEDPAEVKSMAHVGETGVDEQSVVLMGYAGGRMALLSCAVRTNIPHNARIIGTKGSIFIPDFWHATTATLVSGRGEEEIHLPFAENGYEYEAREVMDCVGADRQESAVMPLRESLRIARTMDALREQWDLRYPCD